MFSAHPKELKGNNDLLTVSLPARLLFLSCVIHAHSVFATCCALNVPASASARPSSPRITPAPGSRPIVAYAHRVRSCTGRMHATRGTFLL